MIRACIRMTMLATPLIVGFVGCTTSTAWLSSSKPSRARLGTELSTERLMAIGRMLERQGRIDQAKRAYVSVARRDANHEEAARRVELLAAYERKLRGIEPSQQIAKRAKRAGRRADDIPVTVSDVKKLSEPVDANPFANEWSSAEEWSTAETKLASRNRPPAKDVVLQRRPLKKPEKLLQPVVSDVSVAVATSEAASDGSQDFLIEVALTVDEELQQLVRTLNQLRPLVQNLDDENPAVRKGAATELALRGVEAQPALPALSKRLTDADAGVRVRAARAIWEIDKNAQQVIPVLSELACDRQAGICCMAAFLLGEIGPDAADALPALQQVLQHTDGLIRVHIAEAIARIAPQDRRAKGVLVELLGDADSDVRWLATCALEAVASADDPQVVGELTKALRDRDPRVRSTAALTLGAFGPSAKRAVPNLRDALIENDPRVREAAAIALANIDPGSAAGNE